MSISSPSERRKVLMLRAEQQRTQLRQVVDVWRTPLSYADQGVTLVKYLKKHPYLSLGSSIVLLNTFKKFRFKKCLSRGYVLWQLFKKRSI